MKADDHCKRLGIGVGRPWLPIKPRSPDLVPQSVRKPIRGPLRGIEPWPLVLIGEAGSGKTCASLLLLDFYRGYYATACDLCQQVVKARCGVLQSENGFPVSEYELLRDIVDANLMVLDELGNRSKVTDTSVETIHRLLDAREGLPTVVISNRTIEELAGIYGDPIASRLNGGTRVQFPAEDLRAR